MREGRCMSVCKIPTICENGGGQIFGPPVPPVTGPFASVVAQN